MRNAAFISGAPPVMSTVCTDGDAARSSSTRCAVASSIVSVRFGDDSTWQCVHAWLQYSPTFTCSVVTTSRRGAGRLRCARNGSKSGTPSASSARRRFLRSSSVSRCCPTSRSCFAVAWNSGSASISRSVVGMSDALSRDAAGSTTIESRRDAAASGRTAPSGALKGRQAARRRATITSNVELARLRSKQRLLAK